MECCIFDLVNEPSDAYGTPFPCPARAGTSGRIPVPLPPNCIRSASPLTPRCHGEGAWSVWLSYHRRPRDIKMDV